MIPLILILLYQSSAARAQPSLTDSLVKERIGVIQDMLDQGKRNANRWWYGWLVGYSAATAVQGTVALLSDKLPTRQDMVLGAFTTLLGAAGQVIAPMTPGSAPDKLRELPEGTPEESMMKLQEAEKLLAACAQREINGRSWKTHVVDGLVNVSCGVIVWFGFKRTFVAGLENTAINTAICEAQIFTQPVRAIRDYKQYCQKYKPGESVDLNEPSITWSFTLVPGGIGVRLAF